MRQIAIKIQTFIPTPAALGLVMLLLCSGSVNAALPKEVQADLLQEEIIQSLKSNDMDAAAKQIQRYRALGVEVPPTIMIIESKVAIARKEFVQAKRVLEEYFNKTGTGHQDYKKALALYRQVQAPAKQQAGRQAAAKALADEENKQRAAHSDAIANCNRGSATACNNAGYNYDVGRGVRKDAAQAVRFFSLGCDKNDGLSCSNLGLMYSNGRGVTKDFSTAVAYYKKACGLGDHQKGCLFLGGAKQFGTGTEIDPEGAKAAYSKSCKAGNNNACVNLKSVPKSKRELFNERKRRCDNATDPTASADCFTVAIQYSDGKSVDKAAPGPGIPKNPAESVKYYAKACDLGHPQGCLLAALSLNSDSELNQHHEMLSRGCKLKEQQACDSLQQLRDKLRARTAPLQTSCDNGNGADCRKLGMMYDKEGNGVIRNDAKAVELYTKGCSAGDGHSCYRLALSHAYGDGTVIDFRRATEYYRHACNSGYPSGCSSYARALHRGKGVARDYKAAREWYELGCERGDPGSCAGLGVMYENGDGVFRSKSKAFKYFEKACALRDSYTGCLSLGEAYENGKGTRRNTKLALEAYDRSCRVNKSEKGCSARSALKRKTSH